MKKEYEKAKLDVISFQDSEIECLVASVEAITPDADGYWGDEWNG